MLFVALSKVEKGLDFVFRDCIILDISAEKGRNGNKRIGSFCCCVLTTMKFADEILTTLKAADDEEIDNEEMTDEDETEEGMEEPMGLSDEDEDSEENNEDEGEDTDEGTDEEEEQW